MSPDPETFVRENYDTILRVIRHGDDEFTRALALAVLVEYGPNPSMDDIRTDLERMEAMT